MYRTQVYVSYPGISLACTPISHFAIFPRYSDIGVIPSPLWSSGSGWVGIDKIITYDFIHCIPPIAQELLRKCAKYLYYHNRVVGYGSCRSNGNRRKLYHTYDTVVTQRLKLNARILNKLR